MRYSNQDFDEQQLARIEEQYRPLLINELGINEDDMAAMADDEND